MQELYSLLAAHPAAFVEWFILLSSLVVALLPQRARDVGAVGLAVRILGVFSVLTHRDVPGTLQWPLIGSKLRESVATVLREREAERTEAPGKVGPLLVLLLAGLLGLHAQGCAGSTRDTIVASSNVAARAVNAASGPVLNTYCAQSMQAIGRVGSWEGGACVATGPRAGTPATDLERANLRAVRERWGALLGSCRGSPPPADCTPGVWDSLVSAQAALLTALDVGDAQSTAARLAGLMQIYGRVVELARAVGVTLPGVP